MSVHYPETLRRYNHYRKKDDFVVIKYSTEWCRPCKAIMPEFEKLAKEYPHVYFLDVDIENEVFEDLDDLKDIRGVPTFKFFIGKEVKRSFAGADIARVREYVSRYGTVEETEEETEEKTEIKEEEETTEE
jgi:thiol-disulfide isomerase/thioredoxin